MNRVLSYLLNTRCPQAMGDAEIALSVPPHLSMPPHEGGGYHTESEANSVLAGCHMDEGDHRLAYAHAEAAPNVAITSGHAIDDIALLVETRDLAKSLADSQNSGAVPAHGAGAGLAWGNLPPR